MHCRPTRPSSGQLLYQLGYDLNEDEVAEKINTHQREGYQVLVAEEDTLVVGFAALHWFDLFHQRRKIGRITAFCVDESRRSRGIGRHLLAFAEKTLLAKGCKKFEVTSNTKRLRAHTFYINAGYIEDSRRFVKYLK